jgi:hypothetical protein
MIVRLALKNMVVLKVCVSALLFHHRHMANFYYKATIGFLQAISVLLLRHSVVRVLYQQSYIPLSVNGPRTPQQLRFLAPQREIFSAQVRLPAYTAHLLPVPQPGLLSPSQMQI